MNYQTLFLAGYIILLPLAQVVLLFIHLVSWSNKNKSILVYDSLLRYTTLIFYFFLLFFFVFANNYWCIFCIFCILSTFQIQLILSVLKPLFHPATQLIKNLIKMNNHFRYNIVVAGRNWRINLCTFRSSCSSVGFGFVN